MLNIELKWVIQGCVSAVLIVFVTAISDKYPRVGALTASIPIISVYAMVYMHINGEDLNDLASWSIDVFWLVLSSLSFFLLFPYLVNHQFQFLSAFSISLVTMVAVYTGMIKLMEMFGKSA